MREMHRSYHSYICLISFVQLRMIKTYIYFSDSDGDQFCEKREDCVYIQMQIGWDECDAVSIQLLLTEYGIEGFELKGWWLEVETNQQRRGRRLSWPFNRLGIVRPDVRLFLRDTSTERISK